MKNNKLKHVLPQFPILSNHANVVSLISQIIISYLPYKFVYKLG